MQEPFDVDQVRALGTELEQQPGFNDWIDKTDLRYRLRHGLEPVEIPGIVEKLEERSPAINEDVLRYVNRFDGAELVIDVMSRTDDNPEASQKAENYFYQEYHDTQRRRTNRITAATRRCLDQQAAYGMGILHKNFRPDIRDCLGEQIATAKDATKAIQDMLEGDGIFGNPFVLSCPDLRSVFYTPDRSIFAEVGKKVVSPLAGDAEDLRPYLSSDTFSALSQQSEYNREVDVLHLETCDWIYDVVGDYFERRPNFAGRPWYVLVPGNETSERAPVHAYQPLVSGLYRVVQRVNILETLVNSGALQTGRNMWQQVRVGRADSDYVDAMQNLADDETPVVMMGADREMLPPPLPGHEWRPIAPPDQSQVLNALEMKLRERDKYGFPMILAPDAPLDAKSGYDRSRQMEAASDYLKPALKNYAAAWEELFLISAEAIQAMKLPVTVLAVPRAQGEDIKSRKKLTVRPEDFKDIDLLVRFESVPSTVKYGEIESDMRKLAGTPTTGPLMSKQTFMSKNYDDPIAEQRRIDLEEMRQPIKDMAKQDALQIVSSTREDIMAEEANAAGYPLRAFRPERPEGGAMPGLGAPIVPPEQSQPGDMGMPPSQGSELVGAMQ